MRYINIKHFHFLHFNKINVFCPLPCWCPKSVVVLHVALREVTSHACEGVEKRIEKEIEKSDSVRAELNEIVMRMEEMMSKFESPPSIVQPSTAPPAQGHSNMASGIPQQSKAEARLPKLEVRKFNGKVQEW